MNGFPSIAKDGTVDVKTLVDDALEFAVVPSFTDVGFALRRRMFDWPDLSTLRMDGRVVVLTGATSGLGLATARLLASLGAELRLVVRDRAKGEDLASELGDGARVVEADLSDLSAVRRAGGDLAAEERIDVLIHNAGALFTERRESVDGHEMTIATMVLGPFLLTELLAPALERTATGRASATRVIWVASGGMYVQGLCLDDLMMERGDYRGSVQYARAKRAQVLLAQGWARRLRDRGVVVHAMHPGWADTPGVAASLPTFRTLIAPLLRSPEHGADTIVWLAAAEEPTRSTGRFWHDRRPRTIDRLASTHASDAERAELWAICEELTAGG